MNGKKENVSDRGLAGRPLVGCLVLPLAAPNE